MPSIQDLYNVFENEKCFRYTKLAGRYGISHYLGQVDRLQKDTGLYGENFPHREARLAEIQQMADDIVQMMVDHHETEAVAVLEQDLGIHFQPSENPAEKEWTLWHRDTFDHGPASVDVCGTELTSGLVQLWRHVLRESIRDTGYTTFSDFKLTWKDGKTEDNIEVRLESNKNTTLAKIRQWVYPPTEEEKNIPVEKLDPYMEGRLEDYPLLQILAHIHFLMLRDGRFDKTVYIDPRGESVALLGFVTPMVSAEQLKLFGAIFPNKKK